jgi:hypothetical protein
MARNFKPREDRRLRLTWRASVVWAIALTLSVAPSIVTSTNALMTSQATIIGNTFTTAAAFPAGSAYVWAQSATITPQKSKYRVRITITVRADTDNDGIAEITDAPLDGASVSFEFRDASGAVVGSGSGSTDATGQFVSRRFNNIAAGSYDSVVTSLTHATETWVTALDAENPAAISVP